MWTKGRIQIIRFLALPGVCFGWSWLYRRRNKLAWKHAGEKGRGEKTPKNTHLSPQREALSLISGGSYLSCSPLVLPELKDGGSLKLCHHPPPLLIIISTVKSASSTGLMEPRLMAQSHWAILIMGCRQTRRTQKPLSTKQISLVTLAHLVSMCSLFISIYRISSSLVWGRTLEFWAWEFLNSL